MLIELAEEKGLAPKLVAATNGGEYSSSCPACDGKDRFRIWPSATATNCLGRYWCRRCEISGDTIQFARDFLGYSFFDATERVGLNIKPTKSTGVCSTRKSPIKEALSSVILQKPSELWIEKAHIFVDKSHQQLLKNNEIMMYLNNRGISIDAACASKLGWNPFDLRPLKIDWGVEIQDHEKTQMWLPQGIVIPSIDLNGEIIRLKIRLPDWRNKAKLPKYVAVSGSMNGFNIVGNTKLKIMIVVESELDALLLQRFVEDFAFIVSIGGNNKNRDNVVDHLATSKRVLVCHDNDDGGKAMLKKWQEWYPRAVAYPTPIGNDMGEAIVMGFDLREWLLKAAKTGTEESSISNQKNDHCPEESSQTDPLGNLENILKSFSLNEEESFYPAIVGKSFAKCDPSIDQQKDDQIRAIASDFDSDHPKGLGAGVASSSDQIWMWSDEEQALIDWFLTSLKENQLPSPPFKLSQATTVSGAIFYDRLKTDIAAGANGPIARTGVLQENLRRLQAVVNSKKT
jgi:hypothetical protein